MSVNKPLTRKEFLEQHNCTLWDSFAEQAYRDYISNEFPKYEKQDEAKKINNGNNEKASDTNR